MVIDTFDSNEALYARIKAGATGYDLLTPSSYMVGVLHAQGMLQPLDASRIPNRKNVDPEYLRISLDPEMHHSVPYMLVKTGLGIPKEQGEGRRRLLGDARPGGPQGPHHAARRHARDDRRPG